MIIQMIYQMSGGRYDDRAWPPTWTDFEVPDEEGQGLVACGAALYVGPSTVAPEHVSVPEPAPVPEPVLIPERAPEPAPAPAVAEVPQPTSADLRATWIDYAVSRGANRAEVENQTKAQLQAAYGGRL